MQDLAGLSISLRIDPEQFNVINRKLDQLLAQQTAQEQAKIDAVTAGLKKSGDDLTAAVAQDQPK